MPAISSSACSIVPPYFQISRPRNCMISDDGRDRVAAEELAAGEDGGRGAHVVAVDHHLALDHRSRGGRASAARAAGAPRRTARPAAKAFSLPLQDLGALLAEASCGCRRAATRGRRPASPRAAPARPCSWPSRCPRASSPSRRSAPRAPRAASTPGSGSRSGATPARAVVDDGRAAAHRQLGAELQEVVPVERDGHVERAARAQRPAASRAARGRTTRRRGSAGRSSWSGRAW